MHRIGLLACVGSALLWCASARAETPAPEGRTVSARSLADDLRVPLIELETTPSPERTPVVTAVAIHPAGSIVATAGDDHRVRLWNLANGQVVHVLRGHRDWVRSHSFSPDGTTLASAGDDRQIIFWQPETGERIGSSAELPHTIYSISYSPDGSMLAATGFDKHIHLLNASTGKVVASVPTSCPDLRSTAFSANGQMLAAGGALGKVVVLDTATHQVAREIKTALKRVRAVCFAGDGTQLVTAGEGPAFEVWNASTGAALQRFSSKPFNILAMTTSGPDQIVTGGTDNVVRLWSLSTQTEVRQLEGHLGSVASLAFDPGSGVLVSGSFDASIRIWRLDPARRQVTSAAREGNETR